MSNRNFQIDGDVLVRYSGTDREVVVPDGVRVIGEGAFRKNSTAERIVLPAGLKEIREEAFKDCTGLRSIELPDSLEIIGRRAFLLCQSLADVILPDRPMRIGYGALAMCSTMTSIRIPPSVTELPEGFLLGCTNLERVELPEGLKKLGSKVFFTCESLRELALPSTLEFIGKDAFRTWGGSLRLSFPSGIAHPTPGLLSSLLSEDLAALELHSVPIPSLPPVVRHAALVGLAEWEERGNVLSPAQEADIRSYLSTELPSFLWEVTDNLLLLRFFIRRNLLTRESAQVLLNRVDSARSPETTALLLSCLEHLPPPDPEEQARNLQRELETGYLSEADFDASWTAQKLEKGLAITEYHGANRDGHIVIPAGRGEEPVVGIRAHPFRNTDVSSLVIPEGVQWLDPEFLSENHTLERVSLPSTLMEIPRRAFHGCRALVEVRMAPGIEIIQEGAFRSCSHLTVLDLPEGIKHILRLAFDSCSNLAQVSFPSTLDSIEDAFLDCRRLQTIEFFGIPKKIDKYAFRRTCTFTIRTPSRIPKGPFRNWLRKKQAEGCKIISRRLPGPKKRNSHSVLSGQQDNSRKINAADPLLSEYYRRHDELWSAFHRKNEEFRTVYQEYPMDFDYNTNIPELMEVQKEFCRNALALMKEYSSLFP